MTASMTRDDKLIHMANQIATFFAAEGEARAVPGIADHIRKFWTPEMRRHFVRLAAADDSRLTPHVRKAAVQIGKPG